MKQRCVILRKSECRIGIVSNLPPSPDREWPGSPSLRTSNDHVPVIFYPSLLLISSRWGLIDLPLRASNEGLLRPRVARAQKIISLPPPLFCEQEGHLATPYPFICTSYHLYYFIFKGSLVDPQLRASNEHIPIVRVLRARRTV